MLCIHVVVPWKVISQIKNSIDGERQCCMQPSVALVGEIVANRNSHMLEDVINLMEVHYRWVTNDSADNAMQK